MRLDLEHLGSTQKLSKRFITSYWTAGTYVTKAAARNGWEAGRYLIERYEGFSKQRAHSLQTIIENIRHIHGTNMTRHIDKLERICGMMAHNDPNKPPTDEDRVDWFMASVTEKTYDSVHASCTDKQLLQQIVGGG